LAAASLSLVVSGVNQKFDIQNKTPIPVKITVLFDKVKKSIDVNPGAPATIAIKLGLKGYNKELKQFAIATSSKTTTIDVKQTAQTFILTLTGPKKDSKPLVYDWNLEEIGGFENYPSLINSGKFE